MPAYKKPQKANRSLPVQFTSIETHLLIKFFKLKEHYSSYLGEAAAILEALKKAPEEENLHIMTDSLATITSIKGYQSKKHSKKRYQIGRAYLKLINQNIKKLWKKT